MPPKAAATESWKKRSGSASDATRVCVCDVDDPGQDEQPRRVDDGGRVRAVLAERRLDRLDPPAAHADVRTMGARRGDDRPATYDEVEAHAVAASGDDVAATTTTGIAPTASAIGAIGAGAAGATGVTGITAGASATGLTATRPHRPSRRRSSCHRPGWPRRRRARPRRHRSS